MEVHGFAVCKLLTGLNCVYVVRVLSSSFIPQILTQLLNNGNMRKIKGSAPSSNDSQVCVESGVL